MNTEDPSKLNYTEVNIRSPGLRTFLKEKIASDHPNQSWEGQVINMVAPFAPIVFNWDKLDQETKAREGDDTKLKVTRQDLADLLYHLKRTDELTDYFKTRESNREANLTTYSTMWTIFAPGTEVVVKTFLNNLQVFRVSSWPKPGSGGNRKSVICWGYDWNGKDFVKCFYTFSIGKFEGTKEIDTLDYYPLEFYQDETLDFEDESGAAGHLRTSLIERGQLFHELYKTEKGAKQMFDYNGLVLWSRFGRGAISKGHKDVSTRSAKLCLDPLLTCICFFRMMKSSLPHIAKTTVTKRKQPLIAQIQNPMRSANNPFIESKRRFLTDEIGNREGDY